MTAFSGPTFSTQSATEQIRQLRQILDETTQKLDGVRQRRIQTDEEITTFSSETKQRVNLLMENTEVVDMLPKLGLLLQEEEHLNEQLTGQSEMDRDMWQNLQNRNEQITNKVQSLGTEIVEVTRQLEEARAYYIAAQSSGSEPTSKAKRNPTNPK